MVFVKRMICEGFKSFRKKTVVNFDPGFTAIVGANGSGKSNIIDAFVFVLGELSAKTLRANNIKDLISNGGNGLAESDTATVEIVFDNYDRVFPVEDEEVRILRKIDRDGNGIYKFNGKKSTRKEIMDMLELAGMSPNSSNMIMQGELFRLITMNTVERRQLIEDIAGIASYNDKKNSAQEELTKVQTNLGQITILMNEVRTQMEQLEKEKNDALHYLDLVQQEKVHRNALFFIRIKQAQDSMAQMQAERVVSEKEIARIQELETKTRQMVDITQRKINDLQVKIKGMEDAELAQLTSQLNRSREHLTELKTMLRYAKKSLDTAQIEKTALNQKLQELDQKEVQYTSDVNQIKVKKEALTAQITEKTEEIVKIENQLHVIDEQYTKIKLEFQELTNHIAVVAESKNTKETEMKILENQINSLHAQKQKIENKIFHLHEEIKKQKAELVRFQDEKAVLIERNGGEDLSKENLERIIKELEQKVVELEQTQKKLNQISRDKHASLVEMQSKLKAFKQMNANNYAVECILKIKKAGDIPGIFGTIAELGSCESEYSTAMEMAAGGKFNWIVVDHAFTAEKCINYLKTNNCGRATFIPLSAVQVSSQEIQLPDDSNIHGKAIDLITFDPLVRKAFEFVFGRTVIVEDIKTANNLRLPVRRVTMDGDVVESSNVMSGGQKIKPTGVGFKSTESSQVAIIEQEYASCQHEIETNDAKIKELQTKISNLYRKKISGDKDSQKIAEKISVAKNQLERIENDIHSYEQEIDEIHKQIQGLMDKQTKSKADLDAILPEYITLTQRAEAMELQMRSSEENTLKKQVRQMEDQLKRLTKDQNVLDLEYSKKNTVLTETIQKTRHEIAQQIQEKEQVITTGNQNITENTKDIAEATAIMSQLEHTIAEKNAILGQVLDERKGLILEISQLKTQLAQYGNDIHPLQLKINTISLKINEYESKIGEWKCQTLPDIAVPEVLLTQPETDHSKKLEAIVGEKTRLGAVNLKAIERYQEIETRFRELEQKNENVIEEREAILQFIANLEAEKKKVFLTTFNNINKNFGYIFSRLSPGGEAKLEVENLEDPFAGGVEILARPGEKKWCLTQAMSGGEKTLTIIALILGIQMHVPSPYYVLDEIDAALDFANAALVADLIKELSGRSQFIVITHRDVTMARTDHLLGVSNREGVTSVVNLSIRNVMKALETSPDSQTDKPTPPSPAPENPINS